MLRTWLDEAGLRVEDLTQALQPEHFENGHIPARSTVADRLAGVNPRWDFVEAVADACSPDDPSRKHLLAQALPYWERICSAPDRRIATNPPASPGQDGTERGTERLTGELVAVQRHSLVVSDKLLRALERVTELEQERNNAHQMVLLLLTMVEKLRRDIATLHAERDRLHTSGTESELLRQIRERLERSETQRAQADSELERARNERHKADRLAEQAAEQVRALTDELEQLRRRHPGLFDTDPAVDSEGEVSPATDHSADAAADDIDLALAKAASHLDDGADRLDRLADELRQEDVSAPDNPTISTDALDNSPDNYRVEPPLLMRTPPGETALAMSSARDAGRVIDAMRSAAVVGQTGTDTYLLDVLSHLRTLGDSIDADLVLAAVARIRLARALPSIVTALRGTGREDDAYRVLTTVGRSRSAGRLLQVVAAFRAAGHHADAYQILSAAGRLRPAVGIPPLVAELHSHGLHDDIEWVLTTVLADRAPDAILTVAAALRVAGDEHHAGILLSKLSARGSAPHVRQRTTPGRAVTPLLIDRTEAPAARSRLERDPLGQWNSLF
ncbi:hypothetical protein [Streptomyces sp. NPDC046261]|uniref:hypothetical protein n=1 Tax=Streptomyces sp. NPDC046261 TaxID=3157200 RepID=UPI0033D2CE73